MSRRILFKRLQFGAISPAPSAPCERVAFFPEKLIAASLHCYAGCLVGLCSERDELAQPWRNPASLAKESEQQGASVGHKKTL